MARHGKIDGACEGKDAWDGVIRSLAPWTLNMVVFKVTEQDLVDMVRLHLQLDGKFEYLGGELSVAGFRDCVRRFMKGERTCLKIRYAQKGAYPLFKPTWSGPRTMGQTSDILATR